MLIHMHMCMYVWLHVVISARFTGSFDELVHSIQAELTICLPTNMHIVEGVSHVTVM